MLFVKNLSYGPVDNPLLHSNLSFELKPGEVLHIKGSNGAGKSLLAKTILGISPLHSGSIENSFTNTRYLSQMQNRATHLPYSLFDVLCLGEKYSSWQKIGLLEEKHLSFSWNKASGGERQRTLLTRFFLQKGELLILDEPFNHLDNLSREKVCTLLKNILEKSPTSAILLISHNDNPSSWLQNIPVHTLNLDLVGAKI